MDKNELTTREWEIIYDCLYPNVIEAKTKDFYFKSEEVSQIMRKLSSKGVMNPFNR